MEVLRGINGRGDFMRWSRGCTVSRAARGGKVGQVEARRFASMVVVTTTNTAAFKNSRQSLSCGGRDLLGSGSRHGARAQTAVDIVVDGLHYQIAGE